MTAVYHQMPMRLLRAIAEGGGGAEAIHALLAARRSKTILLLRHLVDAAAANGHRDAAAAQQAWRELARIQRQAPDAVERVLDNPLVGMWAARTALSSWRENVSGLATIVLAAAVLGRVTASVVLPDEPEIPLPGLGFITRSGLTGLVTVRPVTGGSDIAGRVFVPMDHTLPGDGWTPLPVIRTGHNGSAASFVLDTWQHATLPDDPHITVASWADVPADLWRDRIAAGWRLLVDVHPMVAEELAGTIVVLTPLRRPPRGVASSTAAPAFGCVFMSLPPDPRTAALTLAHELQHAKLAALMDLFPLLDGHSTDLFYAPWRTDPRPLIGLLHGTYAHLGVAGFWRRQRLFETDNADRQYAETEFTRWRSTTLDAARTVLASGKLTGIGQAFLQWMVEVLDKWNAEPIAQEILMAAQAAADRHRQVYLSTPPGR